MHGTRPPAAGPAAPRGNRIVLAVKSKPRLTVLFSVLAAVLVTVVGYGAVGVYAGGGVPRGTRVLGVDIGGLSENEAVARLDRAIGERAARPLAVRVDGREVSLKPGDAGLSFDTRGTVRDAMAGRFGPGSVLGAFFGGRDVAPRVRLEESRLTAALDRVNSRIGTPAREGRIGFRGTTPRVVLPRPGEGLASERVAAPIRAAYLRSLEGRAEPLELRMGPLEPKTSEATVRETAAGMAQIALSGPVTLVVGEKRLAVTPRYFAPHLVFEADGAGGMRPRVDGPKLARSLKPHLGKIERPARDATYRIKGGRPRLVPAVEGRKLEPEALGDAVAAAAVREQGREGKVPLTVAKPRVTTAEARKLGIREKISTFTTRHPCCAPRVTNIQTIADILDGHIVKPGETFSLNGVVGERDLARGFKPAPMILNGRYVDSVGGGISQFVTTMFNAVFFAGLQDVQHMPHSYYISRYPAGRESTVSYPQPDFRWRNDSPHGVLVDTSYTDTSITVTFWGTKRFEIESKSSERYDIKDFETKTDSGDKCIPMSGSKGFKIDVWRIFKQNGKVVRRQKFQTTYLPQPRLTCE